VKGRAILHRRSCMLDRHQCARERCLGTIPSLGSTGRSDENPRVSGKRDPPQVRGRNAARRSLLLRRGGGGRGARAGRQGLGGKGADPRGRARQGRRREGREIRKRGARVGREDPRHDAEDAPDRAGRAEGAAPPHRRGRRHREGALRRHGGGPRHAARGADGLERRRHGHRGSRGENARQNPQGIRRSRHGPEGR